MKLTFLGTGTSQGIPVIGCKCHVCQSSNLKDKRLRSSVHIEINELSLVIDSGPDFRQQILREKIEKLDAILYTHDHKDHTAGLDDVRAFNFLQKKPMEVFAEDYVLDTIRREFSYAFKKDRYPGVPRIELNRIENKSFKINKQTITPIRGIHQKLPVLGFKFENLAYLTDMNFISEQEMEKIKNIDILIINALRIEKHVSHFNLEEALHIIKISNAKKAYLTHMSHALGTFDELSTKIPSNVYLAFDGLKIEI